MSRPAYTVAPAGEDRIGRARSGDRAQEHAFIVVVLTIACTALAIFDLLLLVTTG